MKVLWITNVLFPDICNKIGVKPPVTGGWMKASARAIIDVGCGIELAVATLYGNNYRKEVINGIIYYCLPFNVYNNKYDCRLESWWSKVSEDFKPDVVHIHGTEFPHGLAYLKGVGSEKVVVSIQGLVGVYARYSLGQIPVKELKRFRTIYDLFKGHMLKIPDNMFKSGAIENECLKLSHHVIGRTSWDKDHVWAVNPHAEYHFCNETLRAPFYNMCWEYEKCEPHTIFLSQAHKPIKGIHKVVEALPYIIREFPDVKVYVAGNDFVSRRSVKDRLRFGTYAKYVLTLMERLDVKEHFVFTGLLDETQMAERYRLANVFICPSSIENSPNSLCEAQLMGTPVIASYVGGIPDMVENGKSGLLYRFEEHEMLAACVCALFKNNVLAKHLSRNGRNCALVRHNAKTNAIHTINIYNNIINDTSWNT